MDRRQLLRMCGAAATIAAVGSANAVERTVTRQREKTVQFDSGVNSRGIVVEVKDSKVISVFGEPECLEVFHEAWQTHVWPNWKTHENPAARNQHERARKFWKRTGVSSYWMNLSVFSEAAVFAVEACAQANIEVHYQQGFGNEFHGTESYRFIPRLSDASPASPEVEILRTRIKTVVRKYQR